MIFYAITGLINAIASTVLGLFVLLKNKKAKVNITFALFCLSVAVWSYAYCFWHISNNATSALFWTRGLMFGAIFIPIFYFHFVLALLNKISEKKKLLIFGYLSAFVFLILNFTPLLVKEVKPELYFNFWPKPGIAYHPFLVMWAICIIYCTYLLFVGYKTSSGIRRNQIRYILFGITVGFIGGATNYFLWYGIPIPPVGNILVVVYVGATAYAIVRYRLMDIRVAVRQSSVYIFSFLSILALSFGVYYLLDRFFALSSILQVLIVAGIAAGLFHSLTHFYLKIANRYFFHALYSYQETIKDLSDKLTRILDLNDLSKTISKELMDIMKLDKSGVLLRDFNSGRYKIQHITGFREENGISLVKDNFLTQRLEKNKKPVVYEELGLQIRDTKDKTIKQNLIGLQNNMKRIEAEICLPLMGRDRLKGIIVLGRKLSGEAYNTQDLDLLTALTGQASLAIENAQLYEQVQGLTKNLKQKVKDQTRDIEQLSEIKTEFLRIVNHQLRTPTSIIKGMLSMLVEGSIQGPEKIKETINKVYESAERLETILDDLLDAQDLIGGKLALDFKPTDLEKLINKVIKDLTISAKQKNLSLIFNKLEKPLPPIMLDEIIMEKVFDKLIDNAVLYTDKGGISINAEIIQQENKEFIRIIVQDTGIGITMA
ncbi:MAG: histidine kinase N-terminal 7TM domain-containing protein, partial [bacterium]